MAPLDYTGPSGKVHVSYAPENGLVRLVFSAAGKDDEEHTKMAEEVAEAYGKLTAAFPETKFRILVDLSNAGAPGKEARKIYIKTLSDKRIAKTAFFGAPGTIKAIVSFIISASGRGEEVKFFVDEPSAVKWLFEKLP